MKSVMLNAGGPTVALTICPIFNRNRNDLGFSIAVERSAVTVASIKETRDLSHFLDRIAVAVSDLVKILSEVVTVGGQLGTLNRQLEQQLDGMRDTALTSLDSGAERGLATQLVVARESGAA